ASTAHTRLLHEVDSDNSGSESDSDEDSPYDLQAGHGSKTAGLIYGRLVTEGAFETNERRVNFRYISEEWHRLLGFPSAMGGFGEVLTPGRKRKNASICDEALRKLQLERWKSRRRINIDRELVYLYGEQARFRGVQREAIQAIMMNKSPIVVVMGTGGGKSLSFMLPAASCPGGVTVVVVPLVSLQGDLMERCRKMKIPCAEWRSDQSPGPASLVFVTPESAMTKRFHDYVEGLRVMAQLDGFVFDEAHTILEGTRDFRPKLRELGIDVPDIRVVMHVEMPFEMADYAQQSGRAGRDGKRSEAIVIRVTAEGQRGLTGLGSGRTVDDFINGRVCRRVILDSEMDGRDNRDRCEEGEERCDICQAADEVAELEDVELSEEDEEVDLRAQEIGVQQIRSRVANRAIREAREVELLRERLQERLYGGYCAMARTGSGLPRKIFDMGLRMQACLRKEGEVEKFGGCYGCFLPQELCNRWEENAAEGGWREIDNIECRYRGVMVSTISYVYTLSPDEASELFFKLGFKGGVATSAGRGFKEQDVWKWMGRRIDWGGLQAFNMCRVFYQPFSYDFAC
ncbi:hypothetical protein FPRO04_14699, partial [Fusarium proliferatum]